MEWLTAAFLQQLSRYVPDKKPALLERIRRELLREQRTRLGRVCTADTLFGTEEAKQLRRDLKAWMQKVSALQDGSQTLRCLQELENLQRQADRLHAQTRQELARPGFVDPARLHLFYGPEQPKALAVVEELIRMELFRAAVLGGMDLLEKIPLQQPVVHILPVRLTYYRTCIVPAFAGMDPAQEYGAWAFQEQTSQRAGPLGSLPGFRPCEPDKSAQKLLPGEYSRRSAPGGTIYQGIGCITNLTPDTVEQARQGTIARTIPVEALAAGVEGADPILALKSYYGTKPYLVDPRELFAVASLAGSAQRLARRRRTGQCLLCGQTVERQGAPLCDRCVKKVRVP